MAIMKIERNYLIWPAAGAVFILGLSRLFTVLIFTKPNVSPAPSEIASPVPENAPGVSRYSIPPGNGIPVYSEIEAGIKKDNDRREMVKELMADRDKRMDVVCAEAHMRSRNEPEDLDIPKDASAKKQPSAASVVWRRADPNPDAVNDVKTKGYFVR